MSLILNEGMPVVEKLLNDNIDVLTTKDYREINSDVNIAVVNLMPLKIDAELDILRRLSKSNLNIFVEFIKMKSRECKREGCEYVDKYYKTIDKIKNAKFDGLIITGAPVEHMDFEDVDYWEELKEIMDYSRSNAKSTFYICWAAQAGLYNFYNINKHSLDNKCFGVFEHKVNVHSKIAKAFDRKFYAPHSRHTAVDIEQVIKDNRLKLISYSKEAGAYIVEDNRDIFVMGHSEYDKYTLDKEYKRDISKGIEIELPKNYYKNDDLNKEPIFSWRYHSELLFTNWIKYYLL